MKYFNKPVIVFMTLTLFAAAFTGCTGSSTPKNIETAFTVTFDSNGGSPVNSQRIQEGSRVSRPVTPTKEGFEFGGWFIGDTDTLYDFETPVTGNITIKAKWRNINEIIETNVTPDNIVQTILTLKTNQTLKATGKFSNELIRQITTALKQLYETSPSIMVNLDLSEATGLTSIEEVRIDKEEDKNKSFCGCKNLETLKLPDSVTSIGAGAFYGCSKLKNYYAYLNVTSENITSTILALQGKTELRATGTFNPNLIEQISSALKELYENSSSILVRLDLSGTTGLEYLPENGFKQCTNLAGITIPDSVKRIEKNTFLFCKNLTSITIPDSVTSIGNEAFSDCTNLKEVFFTGTAEQWLTMSKKSNPCSYGADLVINNTKIESITIPDGTTEIAYATFCGFKSLTSITIPDSVTSIGNEAFSGCTGLTGITIPDSVTSIGYAAFKGCTGLTSITIPDSVTSIGDSAFSGCTSLTSISIPNSVTTIGSYAFYDCTGLTGITIPSTVTRINEYTFHGCTSFTSFTIPENITSIGQGAFSNCTNLKSLVIPNSVTGSIGWHTFSGCTSLTSITIPDTVTSLGKYVFGGCTSLTSITIPDSVTSIDEYAFEGCTSLTSISIPDSVTSIGYSAFLVCTGLKKIYYTGTIEQWLSISKTSYAYVNGADLYINNTKIESIIIPDGTTEIADKAFCGFKSLTSITIPDSVTSIGNDAFSGCTGLTSITIPDSVTSIGYCAFSDCTGLKNVSISNSVTSIGNLAFSGCTGLTSITIPDSVTSIGNAAFKGCTGLTSITIPDSVTSIGGSAFYDCTGLTSISIPNSVTTINWETFHNCENLTSITIPDSVTSIGEYVFDGCTELKTITFQNTENWKAKIFNRDTNSYDVMEVDVTDTINLRSLSYIGWIFTREQ